MVKLRNGYKVVADDTCYKLVRERTATKKDSGDKYTTEVTIGYYSELNKALDAFVKEEIREKVKNENISIKELAKSVEELYNFIKSEVKV